ncbi:diphosphomevalonate decarboxylase [Liquorilactobacillus sucicola DSM 21376 = JCM 15457]|uniref:diphosphomevalonate decarboxylase n=1 Tax=Liquorilactobacillus sucicola DSM 21376 = JCM 15457 TaxID=1423806 RepID=A0A023CWC7_9LACO|nr:diphosphomevalonate decarboxylase [Liquorilactobacillus sucicola]KRN06195.1 diphosphomevalonate decarboxylase [Liquorilactobacillus sucicola DSM 21376 = JCM 15457]GAJ26124.1 diphosphomevalonate decarboxylase [Liquorilactobacillus sucicola DSM 21376 = JCM 15457]
MLSKAFTARAHTNIALIKYWGKKDQELILPMNSSLSLTLDHFYTDTEVYFDQALKQDVFYLNEEKQNVSKVTQFMNIVRRQAGLKVFAHISSTNHVPTMAGLASSASAYAALAMAASQAAGLQLSRRDLSRLARRGSGSACRSIYGGFVEWQRGHDDQSSFASPIEENTNWNICMIAVVIDKARKKISSRLGMQRVVETSPFYTAWMKSTERDLAAIKEAIKKRDLKKVGTIAEENAMKMHALNMSAHPHFSYFEPASIAVMHLVELLRSEGICCYYTLDAGPNVKILCSVEDSTRILDRLAARFDKEQLLVARPGPGVHLINKK